MKTLFKVFALAIIAFGLNGCYLAPFAKYSMNKEGFKNFSKKEKLAGNNENPERAYHINKYDWDLEILPEKKRIIGKMIITFSPEVKQDTFLFDLQKSMKVENFKTSKGNSKIIHKGDFLYLIFEVNQPKNERIAFTINYSGKPRIVMKEGPIQWKKDKLERHWISSSTEGIGPHFMMPCSALLNKEPDSTSLSFTVPNDLVVASNGQLRASEEKEDKKTYHYEVTYPINNYNISFNIGHFVLLNKAYTDVKGVNRNIECYVMDYNQEIGNSYYDQAPKIMKIFETIYGEFPWWRDGCRFIESTFSAMEHQSGIAMGDDYELNWKDEWNMTLIHELSHEWWGNSITGKDYCDIWIHEGMATFSEALFLEQIYGEEEYYKRISQNVRSTYNTIPIHKQCGVLYNSWTNGQDQDIYDKGALMMNSLRQVVNNNELFMKTLLEIQTENRETNLSSEEMIKLLNTKLGDDYSSLFNKYLDEAAAPQLDVFVDRMNGKLFYKWKKELLFMKEQAIVVSINEIEQKMNPSTTYQSIAITKGTPVYFKIEKGIYYSLKIKKEK